MPPPQAILFFLWGTTLAVVGLLDTVTTLSLGDRLSSALLAIVGIAIILGGIVSWKSSPKGRDSIALATAALSLVTGIVILSIIRSNFEPQPRLLAVTSVVATISLLSFIAASVHLWKIVRRPGTHTARTATNRTTNPPPKTIRALLSKDTTAVIGAAATILAAIIVVTQAWYSSQYLPSTATPVLSIKSKLSPPRPHRIGLAATTAQVEIKNTGKAPVTVLTSMYEITGTPITTPRQVTAYPDTERVQHGAIGNNLGPSARYSTFSLYGSARLIQFGQLVFNQAWLEPDESTTATLIAYFPQGKFDLLRLTTDIAFVREDRIAVGDDSSVNTETLTPNSRLVKGCEGHNVYLTLWPVEQGSLFHWLTESDREVVIALVIGPAGKPSTAAKEVNSNIDGPWSPVFPEMHASIQHKGKSCGHVIRPNPTDRGLEDRSMFSEAGSVSEVEIRR
jgi:hypothetical protein